MATEPTDALESLHNVIAFDSRDWSQHPRDAWIYGVILGWDEPAMAELATKHGWSADDVARLCAMHDQILGYRSLSPTRKETT